MEECAECFGEIEEDEELHCEVCGLTFHANCLDKTVTDACVCERCNKQ